MRDLNTRSKWYSTFEEIRVVWVLSSEWPRFDLVQRPPKLLLTLGTRNYADPV